MDFPKLINRSIHCPTLLLCGGSVFIISLSHPYTANLLCRTWTDFSSFLIVLYFCLYTLKGRKYKPKSEAILKTFFLFGIAEAGIALLQISEILPSYHRHFPFTGSFENPAIFAMLLSFCLPIGFFFTTKSIIPSHKLIWGCTTAYIALFLILSNSRTGIIGGCCSTLFIYYRELKRHHKLPFKTICILMSLFILLIIIL